MKGSLVPLSSVSDAIAPRRGRPRKFSRPSRAVTLTLPEEVIEALAALDPDLSRAVVRVAQPELAKRPHPPVELAAFGRHAVIIVDPSPTLERLTGVMLVPLPDGRALISFDDPRTIAELELQIQDLLEDPQVTAVDKGIFERVSGILRDARRDHGIAVRRRNIIVLEKIDAARPRTSVALPRKKSPRRIPA